MNRYHEANRRGWDAVSDGWQAGIDRQGIWRRCHTEPALALSAQELAHLRGVAGKSVCVLGSGDNLVAFALAGMGARVTSVDFSQAQLVTAERRADELGLDIRFLCADVTDLAALDSETFDLVYTGGHVAVWVSDLKRYYGEACRVLRTGGVFMVHEYHPFRRVWKWGSDRLDLEFNYLDRGPFQHDRSEEAEGSEPGSLPSYEFHWTVADYVAAVLSTGCELLCLDEFGDKAQDWEGMRLDGLPESLLLIGRKRGAGQG